MQDGRVERLAALAVFHGALSEAVTMLQRRALDASVHPVACVSVDRRRDCVAVLEHRVTLSLG